MILNQFLVLAAVLFCIGVYGVLARRNGVLVLMSVELMLNAVNINLVVFSAYLHRPRARCSRCSSSPSRRPRSASGSRSCCSSTATSTAPTSTASNS